MKLRYYQIDIRYKNKMHDFHGWPKYTKTIMYILFIKICKGLILIAAGQAYHMVVATKAKAV